MFCAILKDMIILAIETSCDDTCIALIEADEKKRSKINVLSSFVSSQVEIHKKYGGIYPFLAKREHQKNLPLLFEKARRKANDPKIGLIAVTVGPGLEPCLWTGINFAKSLAEKLGVPVIPINHIEAHIYANFIESDPKNIEKIFPALCLVVSGGHTQLILIKGFGRYELLGETRDDAAGECFDKIGRTLGLDYPGGPAIEKEAAQSDSKINIRMPRPMINQKNYDFSFSGLKTAVLYDYKKRKPEFKKLKGYIRAMCAEVQQAIIDVLLDKTIKAARENKVKTIILGGGVTANKELRKQFNDKIKKELSGVDIYLPDIKHCMDNALMVAVTAYYHLLKSKKKSWKKIEANGNLRI